VESEVRYVSYGRNVVFTKEDVFTFNLVYKIILQVCTFSVIYKDYITLNCIPVQHNEVPFQ
jgi:hypothetical protein